MNLLRFGKQNLPSVIQDPFAKNKIESIYVSMRKSIFSDKFSASGTVSFRNGDTKGEQSFEGETFDDVVLKIKAMLEAFK